MLSAEPKAEAENTFRDFDYLGYPKKQIYYCFIIHCFEENNDKPTVKSNLNWYGYWKSNNARATYSIVSFLMADN